MKRPDSINWIDNSYIYSYRNETANKNFNTFHAHQGFEFLYIHSGQGSVMVDGQLWEAQPGTLFLFQPYEPHHIAMDTVTTKTPYIRSIFAFEPSVYEAYLKPFPAVYDLFRFLWRERLAVPLISGLHEDHPLISLFSRLKLQLEHCGSGQRVEETALFLVGFLDRLRFVLSTSNDVKPIHRELHLVEKVMQWIQLNYQEPFDLGQLAGETHMNPAHLSRTFRNCTGGTITDYLVAFRMNKAGLLLRNEDHPVDYIAQKVGYSNTSYFCQVFKKRMGLSPLQYRLSKLKGHSGSQEGRGHQECRTYGLI